MHSVESTAVSGRTKDRTAFSHRARCSSLAVTSVGEGSAPIDCCSSCAALADLSDQVVPFRNSLTCSRQGERRRRRIGKDTMILNACVLKNDWAEISGVRRGKTEGGRAGNVLHSATKYFAFRI